MSSAGAAARVRLRSLPGLAEALLHAVRAALAQASIGSKIVENCVCTLRNLSYRCQEVEDPQYDRRPEPGQARATANSSKGDYYRTLLPHGEVCGVSRDCVFGSVWPYCGGSMYTIVS